MHAGGFTPRTRMWFTDGPLHLDGIVFKMFRLESADKNVRRGTDKRMKWGSRYEKGLEIYLLCVFLGVGSGANAQSVSKCFRADWLQGERAVKLTIDGGKVTGPFSVAGGGDDDATYKFSGTLKGNTLTVALTVTGCPMSRPLR